MKWILPRVIYGNRGDLASRWGVLTALEQLGVDDVVAFCQLAEDMPAGQYLYLPYSKGRNLLMPAGTWRLFRKPNAILWAVGLDLQDDSSLAKLAYLWLTFSIFRLRGLPIICLFQGAGPLKTKAGRWLATRVLSKVNLFIARDPATQKLIAKISPTTPTILGHDAIFLPGFEREIELLPTGSKQLVDTLISSHQGKPVIGINLRQWFHFKSSLLPYELNKKAYLKQSEGKMRELIISMSDVIRYARQEWDARILLISAYQPGILPWEDDLPWLQQLKADFIKDDQVLVTEQPLTMPQYYTLMSRLDVMIGMRLHSSLIALRLGVPSINISYTLKGKDILEYMGLGNNVIDLEQFLLDRTQINHRVHEILNNLKREQNLVKERTMASIDGNMQILTDVLKRFRAGL